MITLDALRSALRHPQPWTAMDELVRREQAAGRKVKEIHDELRALVEPVRTAEKPPEDADDAMMDTLDALAGNCSSESCYQDSPNNAIPFKEEVTVLPRWARVAFAGRCARRVLPLLTSSRRSQWGKEYVVASNLWVASSESIAAGSEFTHDLLDKLGLLKVVSDAIISAANAAYYAVDVPHNDAGSAAHSAEMARRGAGELGYDITHDIRRDFDHLARLAKWHHWTDDTPVPPDVFGPLWPEGPPPGWPADPDLPARTELPLVFMAVDRSPPRLADEVVNLFNALNRYYIARTGVRLTLDGDVYTKLAALVGAGV